MNGKVKSPMPGPDWGVVHEAQEALKSLIWLVENNHLAENDIRDAIEKLKELIETEIAIL